MKKIGFVLLCCSSIIQSQGQITFERNDSLEGGGGNYCCPNSIYILQSNDNGYLSAGIMYSGTNANYFYEKLDSTGHVEWWEMFGFSFGDVYLRSAALSSDSGFLLCGNPPPSFSPVGIVKLDHNGNTQWQKLIGISNGDLYGNSVKQTLDGGYIIAGSKNLSGGAWDAELIKLNDTGAVIWSKAYGALTSRDIFYDIVETDDSDFVAVGSTDPTGVLNQILVVRTNSSGDTIWTKTFQDGFNFMEGISLTNTFDNGFVISGYSKNTWNPGKGSILFKLNFQGDLVWEKKWGVGDSLIINSVKQTIDSGFIFSGNFYNNSGSGCLIKTNSQGDTIWTRSLDCAGNYVCEAYDNGFAVAGGGFATVVKTDEWGNTQCRSVPGSFGISSSSLIQIYDTVNIITDALTVSTPMNGNNATPLIERMLCNSLNVPESNDNLSVLVFPNPSDKILNIESDSEIASLEIYNSMSICLKHIQIHNEKDIKVDIYDLPPSIYFIKVNCKNGTSTLKFLKGENLN